jgi:metal-dependent amidase/aminoacylase/carboxypeptidase family protein
LAADDFAAFIQTVKGVYVHVGTANDAQPNTRQALHHNEFDLDERALLLAAGLHVGYALSVLQG